MHRTLRSLCADDVVPSASPPATNQPTNQKNYQNNKSKYTNAKHRQKYKHEKRARHASNFHLLHEYICAPDIQCKMNQVVKVIRHEAASPRAFLLVCREMLPSALTPPVGPVRNPTSPNGLKSLRGLCKPQKSIPMHSAHSSSYS